MEKYENKYATASAFRMDALITLKLCSIENQKGL